MRVLMQNRATALRVLAGDTVQMTKMREALVKLGVEVDFDPRPEPDLSRYDLVHIFNIIPVEETYRFYRHAKKWNKPIVLTPIYWDPSEFLRHVEVEDKEQHSFFTWLEKTDHLRQEILDGVELLLPNGEEEYRLLVEKYSLITPARIIPNGADPLFYYAKPDKFLNRFGIKDFILSVGRICRRKNQKELIKAAAELEKTVVLIGPVNDYQYYQECRRQGKIKYLGPLSPPWVASAYAACLLHALVSWYDTPGLVNLEAALAGCKVVTTDRGTAREYLGDMAWYCSPDAASIRNALHQALYSPAPSGLREHILANYTWDRIARLTYEAYQEVLG